MELYSISMNGYGGESLRQLKQLLEREINHLHNSIRKKAVLTWTSEHDKLTCSAEKSFDVAKKKHLLDETVAKVLAQFVLGDLREEILTQWVRKEYDAMDVTEQDKLRSYCLHLWYDCESDEEIAAEDYRNMEQLTKGFYQFLQSNKPLHLQGYIRFRLKSYMDDLRSFFEYAVEEFIIDRQYEDFIALLKYFVCEQEVRRPAVHIYHQKGNEFLVLDEKFRPLETIESAELVVETIDKEINFEDMIISTLITVSPKMVYIHTKEPEMQVIRTIKKIFEERAVLCP